MDTTSFTPEQMNALRKFFHALNYFMVYMWKIGMGRMINIWPAGFGRIMVIQHRGRTTGRERLTPVNYAIDEEEIYCLAGFGTIADWYRNMLANSNVELWLPEGKRKATAEDASNSPRRLCQLRKVIIASGFAGPLFGVNGKKLTDEQLDSLTKDYRLIHFMLEK